MCTAGIGAAVGKSLGKTENLMLAINKKSSFGVSIYIYIHMDRGKERRATEL